MSTSRKSLREFFLALYAAEDEEQAARALERSGYDIPENWRALGEIDGNFAIVQNQQSSEIAALVEKLTNSIDALLLRKVKERGIDPFSSKAPRTMRDAVRLVYGRKDPWKEKSEASAPQGDDIQVHPGTSQRGSISPVIYDAGEGQLPEDFPRTFLSLVRGDKVRIPFVQGAFNMGGTGALAFCGERRYQLIGSCRFDDEERRFGFTLVRRRPRRPEDDDGFVARASRYEYLLVKGAIPWFALEDDLDLGLDKRRFDTGTVIKLYSYRLSRSKANIAQDIAQHVSECLVEPLLPIGFVERKERYPASKRVYARIMGIARKVRDSEWSECIEYKEEDKVVVDLGKYGKAALRVYVFKSSVVGSTVKDTRDRIRSAFKMSGLSVVFMINGQAHGGWTSEFISKRLKLQLVKDDVLVFVDCTTLDTDFRNDVFMASRDRLASTDKTELLRGELAKVLKPLLAPIHERRMHSLGGDAGTQKALAKAIQSYCRELNISKEMKELMQGHLGRLGGVQRGSDRGPRKKPATRTGTHKPKSGDRPSEEPQKSTGREIPTIFRLRARALGTGSPELKLPQGGDRNARFATDAEPEFFTRTRSPGDLELKLLNHKRGGPGGNTGSGNSTKSRGPNTRELDELVTYERSGPKDGEIILRFKPGAGVEVGDAIHIGAKLSCPGAELEETFWVRVVEPKASGEGPEPDEEGEQEDLGLPDLILVAKTKEDAGALNVDMTWEDLSKGGLTFDENVAVWPLPGERKSISRVYVNLDSEVLQSFLAEHQSAQESQRRAMLDRYVAAMYLHAVALTGELSGQGFEVRRSKPDGSEGESVPMEEVIMRAVAGSYANLILRFDAKKIMALAEDDPDG